MGGLYSQDSKPKVSQEANAILIFTKKKILQGAILRNLLLLESSQSLKTRFFFVCGNLNGRCEENEVLNSLHLKNLKLDFVWVRNRFLKITRCNEDRIKIEK